MKKKIIPLFALGILALTGCANSDPVVDAFIYDFSDTYIGTVRTALEAEFEELGEEIKMWDGAKDPTTQSQQIDNIANTGSKLFLANLVDQTGQASTVAETAKNKNIPVIYFNREVPDSVVNPDNYPDACFVGTDADEAGYMQGEIIADALLDGDKLSSDWDKNGDGKINYIMLRAEVGNAEADGRTKYSVEEANRILKEAGLGDAVLKPLTADKDCSWSRDNAKEAMDTFIGTYGLGTGANNIEMVIANNDDMALGAIDSLKVNSYNLGKNEGVIDYSKTILVTGVDATVAAQGAISNGQMYGSVMQDAEGMAECIAALSANILAGKDFLEGITTYKWDSEKVRKIRIPYQKYVA